MKAGEVVELGSHTMDKQRMLSFAREFDPQPFHTDEQAAKTSIWGGLIASGWHTGSTLMRLFYDGFLKDSASMGSPGIDELRWMKPVRPGDTLTARLTILEATPSRSRPDRGIIRSLMEMRNQNGEVVMTTTGVNFFSRRPAGAARHQGLAYPRLACVAWPPACVRARASSSSASIRRFARRRWAITSRDRAIPSGVCCTPPGSCPSRARTKTMSGFPRGGLP